VGGLVLALNILFTVLSDASYALIVGCLLATAWLAGGLLLQRLRRISLAGLVLGHVVRPWFAAASMSGSGNFKSNLALVPDIISATHLGKVWYIGSAGIIVLLAAEFFAGWPVRAAALLLIGCAKAASGHASGGGDFTLAELSMFLHLAGTAVWAGTVIVSGLMVFPRLDGSLIWRYARLLSTTVTWALVALLLSGLFTSNSELNGALSGLWTSGWGRILLTKIAFVCLALGLGSATRFRCVQRPPTDATAALMMRLVRAEAAVMIVILCLSGLLANTAPAMGQSS